MKSLNSESLNIVDISTQKFYNEAIKHFYTLPSYVTDLMSKDWWFVFECFPDNQPANIAYDNTPDNNLILICIVKNNKYIYKYDEIIEYSRLFNVEPLPIIFRGKLSEKQLEVIELFLNVSKNDSKYVFDEENFAYFFYKILNPSSTKSYLMDDGKYNDNLEKFVIKIDGKDEFSFEILNPLYNRISTDSTEYFKIYSIIIWNFLQYCQLIALKDIKSSGRTREEVYINTMCEIFNLYATDVKEDIINWDFVIPEFFRQEKFRVNIDMFKNKNTIKIIKSSTKLEYCFKIILSAFRNRRKKAFGIMGEDAITIFNRFIDDLQKNIDSKVDPSLDTLKPLNFKEFFDSIPTDVTGKVYPDTKTEPMKEFGEDKKKNVVVSTKKQMK